MSASLTAPWVSDLTRLERGLMVDLQLAVDDRGKVIVKRQPVWVVSWHEDESTCLPPCEEKCFGAQDSDLSSFEPLLRRALAKARELYGGEDKKTIQLL